MAYPNHILLEQAEVLLEQINYQIRTIEQQGRKDDIGAFEMRHTNGVWVLPELLAAKAQTISAIVELRSIR